MKTKKIFKKYGLQNRQGISLEKAICEIIAEIENDFLIAQRKAFKDGAMAVIRSRWQVTRSEVESLADENGY